MVFSKKPVIIAAASVTACGLLSVFALTTYADKGSESGLVEANSITINPVGYYGETAETALPVIENDFLNETSESLLLNTVEEALTEETETAEMSEEIAELLNEEPESVISSELIVPSAAKEVEINLRFTEKYGRLWETFVPAEKGSEVYAAEAGTVMYKDYVGSFGTSLCLRLENGNFAVYSHFLNDDPVTFDEGAEIEAGALIGHVGISGNTKEYGVGYTYTDVTPKDVYQTQRHLS